MKFDSFYFHETTSPNGQNNLSFNYEGEIRFGPAYYKVSIDGKEIADKLFGNEFLWDDSSKFIALQEWLTTDEKLGPITGLLLIDVIYKKCARISIADKGFITPIKFEPNKIIYKKEHLSTSVEYEVALDSIKNWNTL